MALRVRESWRRDPRYGALVIVFGLALAGFIALAIMATLTPSFVRLDRAVSGAIRSIANPVMDPIAVGFTILGGVTAMSILTLGGATWLWLRGRRDEAILFFTTVAFGSALGHGLKLLVGRARPALEFARISVPDSYSFPSGHALASFLFFGTIVFLLVTVEQKVPLRLRAVVTALCVLIAVSISLSRVYLGVHYLGDVIGGWLLGSAIMTATVGYYVLHTSGRLTD
ncbi:MAG: phosphatase PAP2 family protein [Coriobacteriia bacterium]